LAAGEHALAAERLTRGLGLWRGPVLEDLPAYEWALPFMARLDEVRLGALEDQTEARLQLGQHADLAIELATVTAENPLRERLWLLHMEALRHTGDRARAVRVFHQYRELLDAELGVAPGPAIQDLHRQLLAGTDERPAPEDPGGRTVPVAGPQDRGGSGWRPPALLPSAVADFTARDDELRQLGGLLASAGTAVRAGLTIVGITGMAGVGKTTLAVQVAHAVAPSYPDGQLFVNLRGAEVTPLDPADVLGRFLRALGVPSLAVPADPLERMELYRTVLSDRRVLVVLDNAGSEEDVRSLLPGSATCAVLITSRSTLAGIEGARWTQLDVLAEDEARDMLIRVVDQQPARCRTVERAAEDRIAATRIVRMCGGLPLAVRIAAARLTARPDWTPSHLVTLLSDEHRRLDLLRSGDLEVRASLALSYNSLPASTRRLFRMVANLDVPDFPEWVAAVILAGPHHAASQHLGTLVDAQLLAVAGHDPAGQVRYRFHDLVRIYARDRAHAEDRPAEIDATVQRAYGAWLALAEHHARDTPGPCYAPIAGTTPRPPVAWILDTLAGVPPLTWFDAERVALLSAIRQLGEAGDVELAFDLAQRMEKYFDMRGMYAEWKANNGYVMEVCRAVGHVRGEAVMLRGMVDVNMWITGEQTTDTMTRAHHDAVRLLDLFQAAGDESGMADAGVMISWARTALGRREDAIDIASRSARWAERTGHLGGQARAHVALAVAHGECQRIGAAIAHLFKALTYARELGNPRYEATVLQFLGIAHREIGDLVPGERFLNQSLAISRRHDDTYTEVLTVLALARLYLRRGDPQARPTAERALAVAREYRMTHHVADSLAILGEVELAAGNPRPAARYLRESVALWRTRGWLTFQAGALASLGRALSTLDRDAARTAFEEARDIFIRIGDTRRATDMDGAALGLSLADGSIVQQVEVGGGQRR
jgi:tetratricopeptide (TPR) repeat protein